MTTLAPNLTLHNGDLSFSAFDVGEGPLVICLHGFPDTARSWRHQLQPLADAGFRVIAPNMRGYEPSSIPADGDYFSIRMAEDVAAWVDQLDAGPAHIVGHDWGASIAFMAAQYAPEKYRSLTMMSVPHPIKFQQAMTGNFKQMRNSWYIFFFQLVRLSNWAVARKGFAFLERLWRKWSPGWDFPADELRAMKAALGRPGVLEATLGYYRSISNSSHPSMAPTAELMVKPCSVPTLGLAGALDGCISADVFVDCMSEDEFTNGLDVHVIDGAGHFLQQENPAAVNALLVGHLQTHQD